MAEKRMFSTKVTESDLFLEMPDSCQNLYFHLSMNADDDGFVDKPRSIMRMLGKKEDDLKILFAKNFIIPFESGVIVIRHWRINNYLRSDRYKETIYKEEKKQLTLNENGEYQKNIESGGTFGIPMVYPEYSISSLNKKINNINNNIYINIIEYLNNKAKTQFKSNSKKTKSLIDARIREKYTLEDFEIVIDNKCEEWLNTDMEKYLRPETLFGNKFESYLNQNSNKKQRTNKLNSLIDNIEEIDL